MATEREPVFIKSDPSREVIRSNTGGKDEEFPPLPPPKPDPTLDPSRFDNIKMSAAEIEGRKRMEEFFALPPEQQVAKLASVLDRGVIFDRLKVDVPPDLYSEWARNDPMSIAYMQSLGFWIDDTYATRRALHSDGSSANIVGDVIHMVTTQENKKIIDRAKKQIIDSNMRSPKKAIEESGAGERAERKPDIDIPTFSESSVRAVTARDVAQAMSDQTRTQR